MKALIIVDVQKDFCEGGSLEVAKSNSIFPFINQLVKYEEFSQIYVTKDWHPANHSSFAVNHEKKPFELIQNEEGEQQMLWPAHCIQYSKGSQLSPLLDLSDKKAIQIRKGYIISEESYSGFGTKKNPTKLLKLLKWHNVNEVVVVGLALDYCVGNTALDAANQGFKVTVIQQATRAVNEQSAKQMIGKFQKANIKYVDFKRYIQQGSKTQESSDRDSNAQN